MNVNNMLDPHSRPDRFEALAAIRLHANFAQDGASPTALDALVKTIPGLARFEMAELISSAAMMENFCLHDCAATNRAGAERILGMLCRNACSAELTNMRIIEN